MTDSESGWCLAEAVASGLGDRVVVPLWGGCAKFILAGIWLQGKLDPFPANRIFINPVMVKKIEQGRKGASSHTSRFLSL